MDIHITEAHVIDGHIAVTYQVAHNGIDARRGHLFSLAELDPLIADPNATMDFIERRLRDHYSRQYVPVHPAWEGLARMLNKGLIRIPLVPPGFEPSREMLIATGQLCSVCGEDFAKRPGWYSPDGRCTHEDCR